MISKHIRLQRCTVTLDRGGYLPPTFTVLFFYLLRHLSALLAFIFFYRVHMAPTLALSLGLGFTTCYLNIMVFGGSLAMEEMGLLVSRTGGLEQIANGRALLGRRTLAGIGMALE